MLLTTLISTDSATLALFDPMTIRARQNHQAGWWCGDFSKLPELQNGTAAFVSLGGDGVYSVRVTSDRLSEDEADYAAEAIELGVSIESGYLFIGPGECIPGGGRTVTPADAHLAGAFLSVAPGPYQALIHSIQWDEAPQWYTSTGPRADSNPPPDIVVVLTPRDVAFTLGPDAPLLFRSSNQWLFPSRQRRLGPEPGMRLETTVVKRRDDLVLKPCGPGSYRPTLTDMSGVRWRDRIVVEVVSVDHEAREFAAVLHGPAA